MNQQLQTHLPDVAACPVWPHLEHHPPTLAGLRGKVDPARGGRGGREVYSSSEAEAHRVRSHVGKRQDHLTWQVATLAVSKQMLPVVGCVVAADNPSPPSLLPFHTYPPPPPTHPLSAHLCITSCRVASGPDRPPGSGLTGSPGMGLNSSGTATSPSGPAAAAAAAAVAHSTAATAVAAAAAAAAAAATSWEPPPADSAADRPAAAAPGAAAAAAAAGTSAANGLR